MMPMMSRSCGALLKCVFACLSSGALHRKHAANERPAIVVDHAFTLQDIGDVVIPARDGS